MTRRRRRFRGGRLGNTAVRLGLKGLLNRGNLSEEEEESVKRVLADHDLLKTVRNRSRKDRQVEQLRLNAEDGNGERDWAGFWDALMNFLEKLLPWIIKLVGAFG